MEALIDRLEQEHALSGEEFAKLMERRDSPLAAYAARKARLLCLRHFGPDVYIRGLIEFTNYCRNNCRYCGIRKGNARAQRYRLSKRQILECAENGYRLGFRTYVLQGGEDPFFSPEKTADIVSAVKEAHPDCAVTLSLGEHPDESYALWKKAGADRYLLRHETADESHYRFLHPDEMSLSNRMRCLRTLKELGYQVGTGFMVGSPGQKPEHLARDLEFIARLQPEMVGIGPFVPHRDTVFANEPSGSAELTLFLLSLIRLMLPAALIPATTSLGTVDPRGREKGILSGANVLMPNLSPVSVRAKYMLYDNKICTNEEAAECRGCLENRLRSIGARTVVSRGDHVPLESRRQNPCGTAA
jgi:biotin synthase